MRFAPTGSAILTFGYTLTTSYELPFWQGLGYLKSRGFLSVVFDAVRADRWCHPDVWLRAHRILRAAVL